MGGYEKLLQDIKDVIRENHRQEITGQVLQDVLVAMVRSMSAGSMLVGIADGQTQPGSPDGNVAYIAGPGDYPNFGEGFTVPPGSIGLLCNADGQWALQTAAVVEVDSELSDTSTNPVQNRAVKQAIDTLEEKIGDGGADIDGRLDTIEGKIDGLGEQQTATGGKIDALSQTLDTVSGKLDTIGGDLSELGTEVDNVKDSVDSVSVKVDTAIGKTDGLSSQQTQMEGKIDALKGQVTEMGTSIAGVRQGVAAVGGKVDSVGGKVDSVSGKVDGVIDRQVHTDDKIDAANDALSRIESAIQEDTLAVLLDQTSGRLLAVTPSGSALQSAEITERGEVVLGYNY